MFINSETEIIMKIEVGPVVLVTSLDHLLWSQTNPS